jgi:hypothetical protein
MIFSCCLTKFDYDYYSPRLPVKASWPVSSQKLSQYRISLDRMDEVTEILLDLEKRRFIISKAEALFCSEVFRFLAAIFDWELISDRFVLLCR